MNGQRFFARGERGGAYETELADYVSLNAAKPEKRGWASRVSMARSDFPPKRFVRIRDTCLIALLDTGAGWRRKRHGAGRTMIGQCGICWGAFSFGPFARRVSDIRFFAAGARQMGPACGGIS